MKQQAQINIIHGTKQLHYLIELHDGGVTEVTNAEYSYKFLTEGFTDGIRATINNDGQSVKTPTRYVQFIRNYDLVDNYVYRKIHNVIRNVNTWVENDGTGTNYYLPNYLSQRQVTLYIPRYSIESFYDEEFGSDSEMQLSGLKYILTAYTYVAGIKVVLGSYLFDLSSSRATTDRIHYKADDYQLCVDLNIVDPVQLTYDDKWAKFRQMSCGEPEGFNNTGSVICFNLEPVIDSDEGEYYIRSSEFLGGITSMPFERKQMDFLHSKLEFNGDAVLSLNFNEVYEGDLALYMAETYGMWEVDEDGNWVLDGNGNKIPRADTMIFELIIRDNENVYSINSVLVPQDYLSDYYIFYKNSIVKTWEWYKDGLIMQGSVEIYDIDPEEFDAIVNNPQYDTDEKRVDIIRATYTPLVDLVSNEVPLNKEKYKFLVSSDIPFSEVDLNQVNMIDYNVNVVNKIHNDIVTINRPEDYKSNIIRPVFISTNELGNLVIHPEVTENIAINLNQYKSKVDLFYLKIEGVEFVEIGRTPSAVVFTVDGHLLPNKVTEGIAYILDGTRTLVTTAKYKYEQ